MFTRIFLSGRIRALEEENASLKLHDDTNRIRIDGLQRRIQSQEQLTDVLCKHLKIVVERYPERTVHTFEPEEWKVRKAKKGETPRYVPNAHPLDGTSMCPGGACCGGHTGPCGLETLTPREKRQMKTVLIGVVKRHG